MATNSVSSSTIGSSAAEVTAANRSAAQKLISSLGAGSGVDVATLAQNLVDAERIPRENIINSKITKNEAKISGYSAVMFMVDELKSKLSDLKDRDNFSTMSVSNSNFAAYTVTANASASIGTHDIEVSRLARAQRSVSNGVASASTSLNGGQALTISLAINPTAITPELITTDGNPSSAITESSVVTFKDMAIGQTVTVNGLTLTATSALTAAQVAAAFSNATAGSVPSDPAGGAFSGNLSNFSSDTNNGASLTFTSSTPVSDVSNLVVSAATKQITLSAGADTPDQIVAAINASGTNIRAQLVNTGDGSANPYKVILTGASGIDNAFTIDFDYGTGSGASVFEFDNSNPANQAAVDALFSVDGITYTRSSNSIGDAVAGLTFRLNSTTSTATNIAVSRDTSTVKDKMKALVVAYKDMNDILKEVSNPKSTLEKFGNTLVSDSTVRSLKQQIRSMFSGASSTPGSTVNSLSQMGFKIDEKGEMTLDEVKLDTVLSNNFDDVVQSFTGGYNNLGIYSSLSAGIAGDAVRKLSKITSKTGVLLSQTNTVDKQNSSYKLQLEQLKERMSRLLLRYTRQFSVMESFVGQSNSQKTSLKTTFDGMMSLYTNKN